MCGQKEASHKTIIKLKKRLYNQCLKRVKTKQLQSCWIASGWSLIIGSPTTEGSKAVKDAVSHQSQLHDFELAEVV